MIRCSRQFFNRPTLDVATDLLGKTLVYKNHTGIITETEAYIGEQDPASHAAKGKTKRNAVMYKIGGFSYVYLIYGMYNCLNFVTEGEGFPAAVLIRSIRMNGIANNKLNGPGKLCKMLGITRQDNDIDLTLSPDFYVADTGLSLPYKASSRIGISVGLDKMWRFYSSE